MTETSVRTAEPGWQLADKMLKSLGGRKIWAEASYLFYHDRLVALELAEVVESRIWRGLERPCEHAILTGPTVDRTWAWRDTSGAGIREGEYYQFTEERMAREQAFWPLHTYTMIHRLAKDDPGLALSVKEENTLVIKDIHSGQELGQIVLDHEYAPAVWRSNSGLDNVEIVYGPVKEFGALRMPRWGAMTDGSFRFEFIEFRLSVDDPPVQFEVTPPA